VIDLRNGDIVQWFQFRGDMAELFDVGVIAKIRCPRVIDPLAPGLEEAMRGEELVTFASQEVRVARDRDIVRNDTCRPQSTGEMIKKLSM
jgi:hypothetical protein